MIAAYEAEIIIGLGSKPIQNYFDLIIGANNVLLFILICLLFFTRRQWKAWSTLEEVSFLLEVFIEGIIAFLDILQKLIDNTAEAPEVWRLVILLLHEGYLWGSIPSRSHMNGHESDLVFSTRPIVFQHVWNNLLLLPLELSFVRKRPLVSLYTLDHLNIREGSSALCVEVLNARATFWKTPW